MKCHTQKNEVNAGVSDVELIEKRRPNLRNVKKMSLQVCFRYSANYQSIPERARLGKR